MPITTTMDSIYHRTPCPSYDPMHKHPAPRNPLPKVQPRIRIHSQAPNFEALTTHGLIDFYKFIDGQWCILFSHPADFTPVCTTELSAFARLQPEFSTRNVKLIGLSADSLRSHRAWLTDIAEIAGQSNVDFPIIVDDTREISFLYDMVSEEEAQRGKHALSVRSVFIIDQNKTVRLTMMYPATTGRSVKEILRCVDALQTSDMDKVVTGCDWMPGDEVIVPATEDIVEAEKRFGEGNVREVKSYLRYTASGSR